MAYPGAATRGLWLVWAAGTCAAVAAVVLMTTRGMLAQAVVGILVVAVGLAMLSSLRFALILSVAAIPMEEFVVFPGAGTLTKLLMLGLAGSYAFHLMRGRLRPSWNAFPRVAWLWLSLAVGSLAWAFRPEVQQTTSLIQLFLFSFIIAATLARRPALAPVVLWSYTLSACTIAVLGVYRFLVSVDTTGPLRASAGENQGVEHFSAYLVPALIVLMLQTLRPGRRWIERLGLALLTVLVATGMLVSGTRSAWVGMAAAAVLLILPRLKARQLAGLVAVACLLVGVSSYLPGIGELISVRTTASLETGGAGRLDIWKVGIGLTDISPLIGVGYANFPSYFGVDAIGSAPFPLEKRFIGIGRAPHSIYLSTLVDLGLLGMTLFLVWVISLVLRLRGRGLHLLAIRAALLAYLVQGLYLDILNRKYFWLFLGLAEGCRWLLDMWEEARVRDGGPSRHVVDQSLPQPG